MFRFVERLGNLGKKRLRLRDEPAANGRDAAGLVAGEVRLLAVTQDFAELESLRQIAAGAGWKLDSAVSCNEAIAILKADGIPIVIYDRDLPGEDWRPALLAITSLPRPACVFLGSVVADDYLWREVVQYRGFDVLPKPFQRDQVVRAVNFTWSWRGWAYYRQPSAMR